MPKESMSETTTIRLSGCAKTFPNGTRALHPTYLEIGGGETMVLLGPSGCGKTTLLRIIAGLEAPDPGGRVRFNEDDVTSRPIEKREVGMVFQSYALFPNMTVRENVGYGLKVRRMARTEAAARIETALEMMAISELAGRHIGQLSGGQRQRVALARAIAVRPRILLLDEPLTALDALLRERLRVEIDRLLRELGITAVYVTHDQSEAMALGDRVAVMSTGRIEQVASPREIYHAPATPFVANFIGTVNRVDASVMTGWEGEGEIMFRPEDAELVGPEEGHLTGEVISALFLGDRTRLVLDAGPAGRVSLDTRERRPIGLGERLGLRIDPRSLIPAPDKTNSAVGGQEKHAC